MAVERTVTEFLSETERKYFDALARYDTIKMAATEGLGIDPQTLYNFLYNLKRKYRKRRGWINAIIAQKRRSSLIHSVLTEKVPLERPEEGDDDEEN
jgi:hypothetical protein